MSQDCNQITTCEVCGNKELVSVLDLGAHPMCDDLIPISDNNICNEYPIEILFCKTCKTAHQKYQVPKHDLFPSSYHYRARFTADVLKGMQGLVQSCENSFGSLRDKLVLDIGCNDGSLLGFFRDKGSKTIGVEPTGACSDAQSNGHDAICDYFSEKVAEKILSEFGSPDIITFTNVFAHIENLQEIINALNILSTNKTKIVIENHYLGSVLDGNQFDTFYHEHPRTYSYSSFTYIAKSLGMKIEFVEFPSRYGGNIRVFISHEGNSNSKTDLDKLNLRESNFFADFEMLRQNIKTWLSKKHQVINNLFLEHGQLRAKAFPGRAAILIKMLELDEEKIGVVYEKPGSLKIGHYIPGTRIPIQSDDELMSSDLFLPIINLAWHIPEEIKSYLEDNGYKGSIVNIMSAEDFQDTN